MNPTAEHLRIASMIEAKVQKLTGSGCDDVTIFGEMSDYMPEFKRLIDTSQRGEMDELCRRFPWFYRYAKILESLAAAIQTGVIKVPK
ncbi:MAG: hypothetical protein WBV69_15560 [Candidatus Sulfotelmatobacter sp.]|jgi:hypothetical protein